MKVDTWICDPFWVCTDTIFINILYTCSYNQVYIQLQYLSIWLVVSIPLKNVSSSDWIIIPAIGENHPFMFQSPPTRYFSVYTLW